MKIRTKEEIKKDCQKLMNAAKNAKTIAELQHITGISEQKIRTTLKNYPKEAQKIKDQVKKNQESQISTQNKKQEPNVEKIQKSIPTNKNKFVIDASITGVTNLFNFMAQVMQEKGKIIITSLTLKELDRLQKIRDTQGLDANRILSIAVENPQNFDIVLIDETFEVPDDCIINYCINKCSEVKLVTADKVMALKARMYGVEVLYMKKNKKYIKENRKNKKRPKIKTLASIRYVDGELIFFNTQAQNQSTCVWSDGIEYTEGVRKLKIGDSIYIAMQREKCIEFYHFRVCSLTKKDNCKLIFETRIKNKDEIKNLNSNYKSCVRSVLKNNQNLFEN